MSHSLRYRFHRGLLEKSPLFLFVHGKAGNLDIMRIFERSVPQGSHLLFVEAPYPDSRGGFSWWDTDLPTFPLEQFENSCHAITNLISLLPKETGINPLSLNALGFSQGSGILSFLNLTGRINLKRLAILAGFVKWPPEEIFSPSDTEIFWGHGEQDDVIPLSRALKDSEKLCSLGYSVTFLTDPVGHKLGSTAMRGLREFFAK